jgi:hypothetical protein
MIPSLYIVTNGDRSVMTFDENVSANFANTYAGSSIRTVSTWDEMKFEMGFLSPEQNETLLVERTVYYTPNTQG